MRQALVPILILILATPAFAREAKVAQLRSQPATQIPFGQQMTTARDGRAVADQSTGSGVFQTKLLGPVLNCGNDGVIDAAGTLVLEAGDAAGTVYAPVAGADSLDLATISFGVIDFGATYPATMAVDFWQAVSETDWDFVVGVDVVIDTNPGIDGEIYDVDLSGLGLRTNNQVMVLLSDLNPTRDGLVLPAGDSSQSCFNGTDYCSVVLPNTATSLFLYGITDANTCPSAVNNILLFDIVVELEVNVVVENQLDSFGAVKARYGR
jgi:hypothetical protein